MDNKLSDLICYAGENSKYYNEIFASNDVDHKKCDKKEFNKIPIMRKNDYKDNLRNIVVEQYQRNHINYLMHIKTSGSTGMPLEILFEPREYYASILCVWRLRKEWYGITPLDKMCSFASDLVVNGNTLESFYQNQVFVEKNCMFFSKIKIDKASLELYYNNLCAFAPKWIYIQPSIMVHFYKYMDENGLSLPSSVKYIELFGETVSDYFFSKLKATYHDINISIMYGAKEVNSIALMCPYGCLHVLEDNVYLESNDGGDAIITSLTNSKVPLIRYNLEDKIKISENFICGCGRKGKIVKEVIGRSPLIEFIDEEQLITADLLKLIIDKINYLYTDSIIEFKLCQATKNAISIGIFLHSSYLSWENVIKNEIKELLYHYITKEKLINVILLNNNSISPQSGKMLT